MIFFKSKPLKELRDNQVHKKIREIKRKLGEVNLKPNGANKFYSYDRNLSINQFLLNFLAGQRLKNAMVFYLRTGFPILFLPLPKAYQRVLKNSDIKISSITSSISFHILSLLFFVYGSIYFFKIIFRALLKKSSVVKSRYMYFDRINYNNLPKYYPDGKSYDIITWFSSFLNLKNEVIKTPIQSNFIDNKNNSISFKAFPFELSKEIHFISLFILRSLKHIIKTFFSFNWSNYFLLKEDIDSILYRVGSSDFINLTTYIVPNHITIFRPIWTYYAEQNGVKIYSYFYSVSSEPESKVENEEDTNFLFLLNWPNILVYNERQKNVLESSCQKGTHIILTEPIYYNTSKIDLLNNDFPILAIFDIEPINFSEHFSISTYQDYDLNNSKFHIKFLQDIIDITKNLNCIVVLKPKREMSPKRQVKDYVLFINNIKSSIKIVDSNIATHRIIEKATCVISFPFTSTAFIAKEYNIKYNAFYDSSCTLSINDRASSGVLMINNKDHLKQWLINCFPVKTLDGL